MVDHGSVERGTESQRDTDDDDDDDRGDGGVEDGERTSGRRLGREALILQFSSPLLRRGEEVEVSAANLGESAGVELPERPGPRLLTLGRLGLRVGLPEPLLGSMSMAATSRSAPSRPPNKRMVLRN